MFNYGNANEAQKEAISATDGLVLITAGPGTGKTFTLVKRAVYLIQECGIKPEQIMMATFTEKAAKELITRITNELAERNVSVNVNEMYIGTFHSLCLRIIKENLEFTRLKRNYRLLDTFDQKYLVFRNFHKFKNIEGIDELLSKGGSWKRSDEICTYINHLSEEMVDIEALQSDDNPGIRTLVFYNYILKCFVLIDLKTEKITHQDVGQMDMYIRMYDELKRSEGDNPTIGIVLCSDTDDDIARYSVMHGNEQLFASKYKLYLPTKEELKAEIETQKAMFYLQQQDNEDRNKNYTFNIE